MQKLYAGALLAIAMPLAAAQFLPVPISLIATPEDFASLHIVPENAFCTPSSTETSERFKHYPEGVCFDSVLEFKLDAAMKLQTMQRQLQKRQAQAKMCKKLERKKEADLIRERVRVQKEAGVKPDVIDSLAVTVADFRDTLDHVRGEVLSSEAPAICPQEGEDLSVYVARLTNIISTEVSEIKSMESVQDLFEHDFWDLPWSMKRLLLAVNIDVGLLDVNDVLPVSKLTPLDHAAQQKDQEMIFFLWERGARGAKDQDTLGYVKKDVMMRSSDERSIEILREIVSREDGKSRDWLTFEWATDLDPELVKRKVDVLVKPVYNGWGAMRPKLRYSMQEAKNIPGDTPGAQLLRRFAQSNTDAGDGCTIL